jgi:hypothetical protein
MTNKTAFPSTQYCNGVSPSGHSEGMTLRDYFAAKVIQGICASGPTIEWSNDRLAAEAYDLADAMLKAREE